MIAGGGALPVSVVRTLVAKGQPPLVAVVSGEASAADFAGAECFPVSVEDVGPLVARLRAEGVGRVVMAGNIERRPRLSRIRWSLPLLFSLPRIAAGLMRGDDALLRTVIGVFEANGMRVVAVDEVVPDLLTPEGVLTRTMPSAADRRDVEAAAAAARAIGRLDRAAQIFAYPLFACGLFMSGTAYGAWQTWWMSGFLTAAAAFLILWRGGADEG